MVHNCCFGLFPQLLTSKDPLSKSFKLHNLNHLELPTGYTHCDLVGLAALLELSPNLENMILDYVDNNAKDVSIYITEILDVAAL